MFGSVDSSHLEASSRKGLIEALNRRDEALNFYKEEFRDQYLLSLREIQRDMYGASYEDNINIGDIVLVSSSSKPRPQWSMAKILHKFEGSDGKTRSVKVLRPDMNEAIYPINLLYPSFDNFPQLLSK